MKLNKIDSRESYFAIKNVCMKRLKLIKMRTLADAKKLK